MVLRKGEPAMDNIQGRLVLLKCELIKIRGKNPNLWHCLLHDQSTNLCTIHESRPAQCQALKCWDSEQIRTTYQDQTMSRSHLFSSGSAMEDIIRMHEETCPVDTFVKFTQQALKDDSHAIGELDTMIQRDENIRKAFQEKTGASQELTEYYLGRSFLSLKDWVIKFIRSS